MPTQLTTELATYRRLLPDLLREHEGEYVLIKEADVIGFWSTQEAARARFPLQAVLVCQVLPHRSALPVPSPVVPPGPG